MFHVKQMRKLAIHARPAGYRRWSVNIQWYPSQTANYGWQQITPKMSGMGTGARFGPSLPARLLCARVGNWIREAGRAEALTRR
jgi:hypothetical protein